MKKSFKLSLASLLVSVATFGMVAAIMHNAYSVKETKAWSGEQTPNIGNYYDSITDSMTGSTLLSKVSLLSKGTNKSYDWYPDELGDEAEGDSTSVLCLYTRHNIKKSNHVSSGYSWDKWNREHVWPQSEFPNTKTDAHNYFACEGKINNTRSSYPFGEVTHNSDNKQSVHGHETDCYFNGSTFEPCDDAKGEVARTIFYGVALYDYSFDSMLPLETALKWNLEHPVTNRDIYRNNAIQTIQKNRNPFVDHPEYACKIWGDTNSTTKSICNSTTPVTPKTLENITVTYSDGSSTSSGITVDVNSYFQLKVIANYSDDSSSDVTSEATFSTTVNSTNYSSYISITNGKLVGLSETNYAAFSVSYRDKSTTRSVYVTAEGSGHGTPDGGDDPSGEGTYTRLTSIADIDETAKYVLGLEGTGFHYSGTSSWGLIAPADEQTPLYYTLTKGSGNTTFTAKTKVGSTTYYLTVPTSNTFTMSTSSESIKLGTTATADGDKAYAVTNASSTARHIRINGTSGLRAYGGNTGNMAYFYKYSESSSTKTLTGISITNEKTEYTVGDSFVKPTVTATYSDGSSENVTNSAIFEGYDMSKEDVYTVTVSYTYGDVTEYAEYDIIVTASEATSITATVNKNFYVGETISKSDITVKDNLNNTITDYAFESYQYTYTDAASGGSLTNKNFTITYGGLTTTLNTKVLRKAHVAPSPSTSVTDTLDREKTGIEDGSTTYGSWSGKTDHSSAVYAGQSAGDKNSLQLRSKNSNSGIITTASGGTLSKVTVVWNSETSSGRTLNVYGKNSPYNAPTDLYDSSKQGTLLGTIVKGTSTELTISGDYTYVGVRSKSDAMYLTSISFTWGGSGTSDSAVNLANYVMFEDNNGQCVNKFSTAKGYFEGLSKAERNTFMTSNDYVIATARERLVAWATYHGKTITNSGDDGYVINSNKLSITAQNNAVLLITIIGVVIISSLTVTYLVIKKRKQD